jgi:hypothetical protein
MKCYYHLHPSIEYDNGFADQKVYDIKSLDIFQMTTKNIESTKELFQKELLALRFMGWM